MAALIGALLSTTLTFAAFPGSSQADVATASPFLLGVDVSSGLFDPTAVSAFGSTVGSPVSIVQNFISWGDTSVNQFPGYHVDQILAAGSTPEITWDPTTDGEGVNQPQMSLASIADGEYDSYITQFAEAAKAVGQPIMLRFAHEMNGDWSSYCECNSGNQPGDFVRAWRHVYDIFQAVGATNVEWIWSPNAEDPGDPSLKSLYPGDSYVDWVGIDGYSYPLQGCETPAQIFGATVSDVRSFTSKPIMFAEVGISAACSDKPELISDLFSWLETQPEVQSFTWWQRVDDSPGDDNDYTVNSDASSLSAFASGLQDYIEWRTTQTLSAPASGSPGGPSEASPTPGGPSEASPSQASDAAESTDDAATSGAPGGVSGPLASSGSPAGPTEGAYAATARDSKKPKDVVTKRVRIVVSAPGAKSVKLLSLRPGRKLDPIAGGRWATSVTLRGTTATSRKGLEVRVRVVNRYPQLTRALILRISN